MDGLKIRQHPNCQRGTADVLAFTVSEVFEHLRVYLCPSTVAGIHTKLVLVGNSSRELALTLQKLHNSLCNCCFKLFGAQPAIPTIYIGTNYRTVSRFQSRRYSILCEIRWNPACLAPCVTGKQGTNQAPLDNKPAIHLSESASTFPACPFTSIHTVNPTSVVDSVTFSCSVVHLSV